ncbi:MAG TPA: hypothetical protein VM577_19465 [Anaerovoracaceae bacterium]|nr:hypothetical protein [Anaerovoracaceae bacterium]
MKTKRDIKQDERNIEAAVQMLEESRNSITIKTVAELSDVPKAYVYRYVQNNTFPICSKIFVKEHGKTGYKKNKPTSSSPTAYLDARSSVVEPQNQSNSSTDNQEPDYTNFLEEAFATGKSFTFDDLIEEASEVLANYKRSCFIQAFHKFEAEKHIKKSSPLSDRYISAYEVKPRHQIEMFNCDGEILVYKPASEFLSPEESQDIQQQILDKYNFSDMKTEDSALDRIKAIEQAKAEEQEEQVTNAVLSMLRFSANANSTSFEIPLGNKNPNLCISWDKYSHVDAQGFKIIAEIMKAALSASKKYNTK